jgi:hypothetical protein
VIDTIGSARTRVTGSAERGMGWTGSMRGRGDTRTGGDKGAEQIVEGVD